MDFTPYLDDLEARISPEIEKKLAFDWENFARGYFTPARYSDRAARRIPRGLNGSRFASTTRSATPS